MEQWTIDGRESIAHTGSLISGATLLQVDRFIAAHFSECKDTEWSDVSGGYRALFCKVIANSEQKSFTRMESSFEVRTKPPVYSEITVSYQYLTLSGLIVDDHTEYPLHFVCGAGEVTQAMEEACLTLSRGDCAVLVFDPRFGFRDEGLSTQHGTLGANDVGILYLHVHEMEIPLDDVQRRERATELKERANVAFRAGGDVLVVERLYDRALSKIGRQPYKGTNAAIRDADTVVRAQILANLQLCALLRNEYTLSIRRGEQLLKLDAVHEKGLYRLALAKYKLSQVEGACSVLEFLLAHNASCKEAEGLLQDIRTSASSQGTKALLFS